MKELSIEEKAQRYDEAIKKAKDYHKQLLDEDNLYSASKIEKIFPELKESEDEKISKELIYFLSRNTFQFGEDIDKYKSWVAWLEKQADTNEAINRDEFAQGVLRGAAINLITWIDYNAAEGNMCLSNMECKGIEDALVSGDWDKIYAYMKKKLEKQGEQTSDKIDPCYTCDHPTMSCNDFPCERKQGEQKAAEWSEDDEVKINRIVACLENLNVADNDILLKDVDWLKSLKGRYTWKPSDEQMEALKYACGGNYVNLGILESLYQDLKKLKED